MAYLFGDGFDAYAAPADAIAGYWDSGASVASASLVAGRFSGSQAWQGSGAVNIVKSSGANDALHHIVCGFQQTAAISGSTLGTYFQFSDGSTNQCCVVFRSDGAILLTSATPAGTVLATYTGAVTATSTWYAFEIEVFISATAGYMNVRKNGNTSNDFTSATNLNTRPGANNYANKLTFGMNTSVSAQMVDDLLWRSDASSVPWVGDVRCFTRRPVSDASVQWTPSSAVLPVVPYTFSSNSTTNFSTARYSSFTAPISGSVGTVSFVPGTAYPNNAKCAIFASSASTPGAILGTATVMTNLPSGTPAVFTFGTPVAVTAGTQYWVGFMFDTSVTGVLPITSASSGLQGTAVAYAAFPTASPSTATSTSIVITANISITGNPNTAMVQDAQQDGATSYVYSSTVGNSDLYGISSISSTPATVVAVTTRAYCQKSDAGTRNVAVQLKSGAAAPVQSASTALNTTWGWISRTDTIDPATGAAWTAVGVNNAQVGAAVTA